MKGFYITVKNGLLDPKHIKAMGGDKGFGTVWLFLYFLDKMTVIDEEIGEGKVLGGRPIKYDDVKEDLGISRRTYARWLEMLRKGHYIKTTQTPYGLSVIVYKAHKVFGRKASGKNGEKTVGNKKTDVTYKAHLNPDKAHLIAGEGTSNIRQHSRQYNKTSDFNNFKDERPPQPRSPEAERVVREIREKYKIKTIS